MRHCDLKNIVFLIIVLVSTVRGYAQENTYTQYFLNAPAFNAAFTGLEDYTELKTGLREGWNNFGVKDYNFYVSAYSAIGGSKRSARRINSLRVSDPTIFERIKTEKEFRRKQGVGGMISNRQVGPYQSVIVHANYAYHLPVSSTLNLSMGAKVGYSYQRLDFTGLTVRDDINDQFYQQLMQAQQGSQHSVLIDFGTVLYSKTYLIGISSQNLVASKLTGDSVLTNINLARYSLFSSGNFPLGPDMSLSPSLRIGYAQDYDVAWSFNSRARYKQMFIMGLGYDSNSKASVLLGFNSGNFQLNYAYDFYLSQLKSFNVSVHEVVVGFLLFNRYNLQPRFW